MFQNYKGRIACVIVEPVAANMGLVLPEHDFLTFLREITSENEALLIFDEVITGFRLGLGGAQEYYGVKPDLTTLGKIVGGGMPLGAYGGRKEIMEMVSPIGTVYQAGTLSGNPVATAAGIKTLEILSNNQELYKVMETKAKLLANAFLLREEKKREGVTVNQIGSLLCAFFTENKVVDLDTAKASDTGKYTAYFNRMLAAGIYVAPSQFEAMFISAAHSDEDIEKTCNAILS